MIARDIDINGYCLAFAVISPSECTELLSALAEWPLEQGRTGAGYINAERTSHGQEASDTFENYISVKKLADVHLAESDLDWVILRPGTLLDSPGTGKVHAGMAVPYGNVARDDVA